MLDQQSLNLCHPDLNAIVDQVISVLQTECNRRMVEWHIARLPALECDRNLIVQVFQNLLSNAVKYSRGKINAVIEMVSIQEPRKPSREDGRHEETRTPDLYRVKVAL